jgi:hypothetical protein
MMQHGSAPANRNGPPQSCHVAERFRAMVYLFLSRDWLRPNDRYGLKYLVGDGYMTGEQTIVLNTNGVRGNALVPARRRQIVWWVRLLHAQAICTRDT